MFRQFGPMEIILVVLLIFLLFGAKRMPDAARSLGRSMRIFKSEVKEMRDDDDDPKTRTVEADPRPLEGRVETPAERVTETHVTETRHRDAS
jgi:sec-independent protein translocase protein TatA